MIKLAKYLRQGGWGDAAAAVRRLAAHPGTVTLPITLMDGAHLLRLTLEDGVHVMAQVDDDYIIATDKGLNHRRAPYGVGRPGLDPDAVLKGRNIRLSNDQVRRIKRQALIDREGWTAWARGVVMSRVEALEEVRGTGA